MPEFSFIPLSEVPQDRHANGHHQWTEAEKELVRQQYGQMPTAILAQQLGIERKYVTFQARRLGLSGRGGPAFRHKWTDDDRQLIRKWYGKVSTEKLAEHIGISVRALQLAVSAFGLVSYTKARPHQWTEEEDELLRREYQQTHESRDHLALKLGLSVNQVHHRLAKLGLLKKTDRVTYRWTPAEVARLEKLMEQGKNVEQIAKLMNRSPNAITTYAHRHLHLSFRDRNSWYTKKEVCEILGVDHKWVQRRIDSGALKASWHHGHEPQKNGSGAWHIEGDDLATFIRTYPEDLNGRNVDLVSIVSLIAGLQVYGHMMSVSLSERENQILALLAQGLSNESIAQDLAASIKVIKNVISRIYDKLQLANDGGYSSHRVQAALYYLTNKKRESLEFNANIPGLTLREREVLLMVAQGYSNQSIADKQGITLQSIENVINRVINKLDLGEINSNSRRVQAALVCLGRKPQLPPKQTIDAVAAN